jgi:hypothetical protein
VQLLERLVADEVTPTSTAVPPSCFVHEDRHVDEAGTLCT